MLLCHLLKVIWLSNRFPSCSPNAFSKSSLFIPSTWRPIIPSRYLTTLPLDTISHYWHLVCCHIHTWGWTAWPWARPGPPWRWSACQCRCLGSEGCRAWPKRVTYNDIICRLGCDSVENQKHIYDCVAFDEDSEESVSYTDTYMYALKALLVLM